MIHWGFNSFSIFRISLYIMLRDNFFWRKISFRIERSEEKMIFFSSLSLKKNQDRIKRRKCNIRGIIWEDLSLFPDIIFTRCWLQRTFISGRELNTNSFPLRTCPHVSHYFFIPFFSCKHEQRIIVR